MNQVGVEDNFFDVGGDSLLAIQMINRANQAGLQISVRQLFQHQTIAELARVVAPHAVPRESESVVGSNRKTGAARSDRGLMVEQKESPSSLPPRPSAVANESEAPVRVTVESLRAYGCEALEKAGLPPEGAAIVTEVQLEASLRGQPTHNMGSIPRYARRNASGRTNPDPAFESNERQRSALWWMVTMAMASGSLYGRCNWQSEKQGKAASLSWARGGPTILAQPATTPGSPLGKRPDRTVHEQRR